jgi:hypothetical protein
MSAERHQILTDLAVLEPPAPSTSEAVAAWLVVRSQLIEHLKQVDRAADARKEPALGLAEQKLLKQAQGHALALEDQLRELQRRVGQKIQSVAHQRGSLQPASAPVQMIRVEA